MLARPAILCRAAKYRTLVGNIRVLERELPDAEVGEPIDITPHHGFAVDFATRHHAGGPDGQVANRLKELIQARGCWPHQMPVVHVIEMVA